MDMAVRIDGLEDVERAIRAAFPDDVQKQRGILNQSMSAAAKKTMLPVAKQMAFNGDSSGALSESLGIRNQRINKVLAKGRAAGVEMVPVRRNTKAIAKYIDYYYTRRGKTPTTDIVTSGIRHGHLVEFGHKVKGGGFVGPRPFMWPAAQSQMQSWVGEFQRQIRLKIEANVKRAARKKTTRAKRAPKTFTVTINE